MTLTKDETPVFIVGGAGNVGQRLVPELLKRGIRVTLYVRSPERVRALFSSDSKLLSIIQGDYLKDRAATLEAAMADHTRMFLIVSEMIPDVPGTSIMLTTAAYRAGVRQVVHLGTSLTTGTWRSNFITTSGLSTEQGILQARQSAASGSAAVDGPFYVTLRPARFMSNMKASADAAMIAQGTLADTIDPDTKQAWISPDDIAAVAANILSDPVQKHANMAYDLTGDVASHNQRVAWLTAHLGRPIKYQQLTVKEKYNKYIQMQVPHQIAYDLACFQGLPNERPSVGLEILLNRPPQTVEDWIKANLS